MHIGFVVDVADDPVVGIACPGGCKRRVDCGQLVAGVRPAVRPGGDYLGETDVAVAALLHGLPVGHRALFGVAGSADRAQHHLEGFALVAQRCDPLQFPLADGERCRHIRPPSR